MGLIIRELSETKPEFCAYVLPDTQLCNSKNPVHGASRFFMAWGRYGQLTINSEQLAMNDEQ